MISVITSATNHTFHPPPGMTKCDALHVYMDPQGQFSLSTWELSAEELTEINRTKRMHLYIFGRGMPPIAPVVFDPWVVQP